MINTVDWSVVTDSDEVVNGELLESATVDDKPSDEFTAEPVPVGSF